MLHPTPYNIHGLPMSEVRAQEGTSEAVGIRRPNVNPLRRSLKQISAMLFGRTASGRAPLFLPRTAIDYEREVGDGTKSDIVMACIHWLMRVFPEAPPALERINRNQEAEPILNHPFLDLLRRPNPYYSGATLLVGAELSYNIEGDAYFIIVPGNLGQPVELWWVPHWMMEPAWPSDGSVFISHYEYSPPGFAPIRIEPEDVIHFRFGFDPQNPRKGLSPLRTVMRELLSDAEAANWTASLLRNAGVPGIIVSPHPGADVLQSPEDLEATKAYFRENFTGDKRGEPLAIGAPVNVAQFGYNPQQMDLNTTRMMFETRGCAAIGIPPIVASLLSGIQHCLPGDARVWTLDGPVPIRKIQPGMQVWSEVDGHLQSLPVTNASKTDTRPVYEIRTKNRVIRSSGNHPLLVRMPGSLGGGGNAERRVSYGYKRADQITLDDYLVQVQSVPDQGGMTAPTGEIVSHDMMRWLGAMVGDGSITKGLIRMAMGPNDPCHDEYVAVAQSLFDKQARSIGGGVAVQEREARASVSVFLAPRYFGFSSVRWARLMEQWGFKNGAKTKRVPGWVYSLRRDLRLAFLAGIVDTDGSVDKRGALKVGFANEALTHDVRDLLIGCGIQCCNIRQSFTSRDALPNPGRHMFYSLWSFTASSAVRISEIPFTDRTYRQRVESNGDRYRAGGFDAYKTELDPTELGFYRARSITVKQPEPLYDIEVDGGGHNFIADGVVVSNSTYSNYQEAERVAYRANLIPTYRTFAETLYTQLLPRFERNIDPFRVRFDLSDVQALQEDENARAERLGGILNRGGITLAEFRGELGYPVRPEHEVYVVPLNLTHIPAGSLGQPIAPPQALGTRSLKAEAKATAAQRNIIRALQRDAQRLEDVFSTELVSAFEDLGARAARAFQESQVAVRAFANGDSRVYGEGVGDSKLYGGGNGSTISTAIDTKQTPEEQEAAEAIIARMAISQWSQDALIPAFDGHYLRTTEMTVGSINTVLNLGVNLPDPVAREIVAAGGRRAGLLDITGETRQAIFRSLADGRAAGEGPPALARRIRSQVPAGRFTNAGPKYRAQLVARTETKWAQNRSALEAYRQSDIVTGVLAFDNQTGYGDDECVARDGQVFTIEQADAEMAAEHPNFTLNFGPVTR